MQFLFVFMVLGLMINDKVCESFNFCNWGYNRDGSCKTHEEYCAEWRRQQRLAASTGFEIIDKDPNFYLNRGFDFPKTSVKETESTTEKPKAIVEYPVFASAKGPDFTGLSNLKLIREADRCLKFAETVLMAIHTQFIRNDIQRDGAAATREQLELLNGIADILHLYVSTYKEDIRVYLNAYKND